MKRIYMLGAIGASGALLALTLTPAAVAGATARASVARADAAATLPNTNIKGKPAHWKPSRLHAKARWAGSPTRCTVSKGSFTIKNKTSRNQRVRFTGTDHFTPSSDVIRAHQEVVDCVTKGYHGTLTGKLKDGRKLKVKF